MFISIEYDGLTGWAVEFELHMGFFLTHAPYAPADRGSAKRPSFILHLNRRKILAISHIPAALHFDERPPYTRVGDFGARIPAAATAGTTVYTRQRGRRRTRENQAESHHETLREREAKCVAERKKKWKERKV